MKLSTGHLRGELERLEVYAPRDEALLLPGFVKDLINAKAIPLGKNLSMSTDAKLNVKTSISGGEFPYTVSIAPTLTFR